MTEHDDELAILAEHYRPPEPVPTEADRQAEAALEAKCQRAMTKTEEAYCIALQQDPAVTELRKREWVYAELGEIGVYEEVLVIDPSLVIAMTVDQVAFVLRHELAHVLLNHHAREKAFRSQMPDNVSHQSWAFAFRVACDLEANSGLLDVMAQCGLQDTGAVPGYGAFTHLTTGLTAEEYAQIIVAAPALLADIESLFGER